MISSCRCASNSDLSSTVEYPLRAVTSAMSSSRLRTLSQKPGGTRLLVLNGVVSSNTDVLGMNERMMLNQLPNWIDSIW